MAKLRIVIACCSLTFSKGGSERAAVNLAEAMTLRGHYVLLLSCVAPDGNTVPAYPLAEGIRHLSVTRTGWHGEISLLRKVLVDEKIDVFLAFGSSSILLFWAIICKGSGIPFICSERTDPVNGIEKIYWNRTGRMAVLAVADCIHELLPVHARSVPDYLQNRVAVIPNAAPQKQPTCGERASKRKSVLYLARLHEAKRPALLIEAFGKVMDKYHDWNLEIWGHGPLEQTLRELINKAGAGNRVRFHGQCDNPVQAYAASDIYCLPSSHEGFPNTVLEAMSAGMPTVGFKSCAALANIVEDNKNGLLATEDNSTSLALTLEQLMSDDDLRARLGAAAKEAVANYDPGEIFGKWEQLFQTLAKSKGNTVMDKLARDDDFTCRAELSTSARSEWILRDFGEPLPLSWAWLTCRLKNLCHNLIKKRNEKAASGNCLF